MIDSLFVFTFIASGLIAIVSSLIEAKTILIKKLQNWNHAGLDDSKADITINTSDTSQIRDARIK